MHLPLSASLNIAGNVGSAKSTRSFGETGPSRRAEAGGGQGSQGVVFVQTMNVGQGAPKAAQADKVTAGRALKFKSIPARQDVGISAIGGQRKPVSASENSIASDSTQVRDLMALFAPNQTPSQLDSGNAIDNDGLYDNIVDINSNADIDRNSAAIAQYFSLGGLGLVGSEKNVMETKHVQPDAASQGGRTQVAAVTGNKGGSLTGNTGQATISAQVLRSGAHAHGDPKMMKECFSPVSDTFIAREGAPDRASLPGASSGLHFSSPLSDLVTSTVAEAGANTLDAGTNMLEAGGVDQARAPEGTGSWGSTGLGGARSANRTEEARKMAVLDALLGITNDEVGRADKHISTPPGVNEAVIDQPMAIGGAIQNIGDLAFGYEINDAALAGGAEEGQVLTWGMMAVDAFNTPTAAPTLASGAIPDQDVDFF